ncbi:MAG: tRNA lysidine(34) synthetase TilS [Desulfobacterales bacterium]
MFPAPLLQPSTRLDRLFDRSLARERLLTAGDRVLVGVSGGPDSMALLYLLAARKGPLGLSLGIAHLDHLLRPESGEEAGFVERAAAALGAAFHLQRVDVRALGRALGLSLEAAGRHARRRFFAETARHFGYTRVALGHHGDDLAESLLLNLLRGAGPLGLSGMRPVRPEGLIRPLLAARRAEVLEYLAIRGIPFRSDPTNADPAIARNRIRHRLLPLLEREYRRGAADALRRAAVICADEDAWLESLVDPLEERLCLSRAADCIVLDAAGMEKLPPAARRRVVRRAFLRLTGTLRRLAFVHVEAVLALLERNGPGGPVRLPHGVRALRSPVGLLLRGGGDGRETGAAASPAGEFAYRLEGFGAVHVPEAGVCFELQPVSADAARNAPRDDPRVAFLDAAVVRFPVTVRNRRPGDRFRPLGAPGSRKLKKFFCDAGVPREERARCPILVSAGRILWVAGLRIDEAARVTEESRSAVRAEIRLAGPQTVTTFFYDGSGSA